MPGGIYICYYCRARHGLGHRLPTRGTLWCCFPHVLHLSGLTSVQLSETDRHHLLHWQNYSFLDESSFPGSWAMNTQSAHLSDGKTMPAMLKKDIIRFTGEGHRRLKSWWVHTRQVEIWTSPLLYCSSPFPVVLLLGQSPGCCIRRNSLWQLTDGLCSPAAFLSVAIKTNKLSLHKYQREQRDNWPAEKSTVCGTLFLPQKPNFPWRFFFFNLTFNWEFVSTIYCRWRWGRISSCPSWSLLQGIHLQ